VFGGAGIARPQTLPAGASTVPMQACAAVGFAVNPPTSSQAAKARLHRPSLAAGPVAIP
jgi:hypothetical protein